MLAIEHWRQYCGNTFQVNIREAWFTAANNSDVPQSGVDLLLCKIALKGSRAKMVEIMEEKPTWGLIEG